MYTLSRSLDYTTNSGTTTYQDKAEYEKDRREYATRLIGTLFNNGGTRTGGVMGPAKLARLANNHLKRNGKGKGSAYGWKVVEQPLNDDDSIYYPSYW